MRYAYLGGTFDPIHVGHLWVAQQVCEHYKFDKVFFVPNYSKASQKWNKKVVASNEERLQMCRLSVKGSKQLDVLPVEIERKFLYTYQTVNYLKTFQEEITWIVGADWLEKLKTFKNYEILKKNCKFIVIDRPGEKSNGLVNVLRIGFKLNSTVIREREMQGLPIKGLVVKETENFIKRNRVYRKKIK